MNKITELSGRLQVEFSGNGRTAKLLREYRVGLIVGGKHRVIIVPAGGRTDFASSPPRLWGLFPPIGRGITEGSVVHDHLYKHPGKFTRVECDEIFFQIMLAKRTKSVRACLGYWAVRLCGWMAWNKYRKMENRSSL